MARRIRQGRRTISTTVYDPAPLAQLISAKLGRLSGSDLNGTRGTIRSGDPAQLGGVKYSGYADAGQRFTGLATVRPAGTIRTSGTGGLPYTQAPWSDTSPLLAQIANAQQTGVQ